MYKPLVGEYLQCVKEPTKWTRMLLLWFVLIAKKEVVGCVQKKQLLQNYHFEWKWCVNLKNEEITETFNDYFGWISGNLDLRHWEDKTSPLNSPDKINDFIKNYEKHLHVLVNFHFGQFLLKKSTNHSRT